MLLKLMTIGVLVAPPMLAPPSNADLTYPGPFQCTNVGGEYPYYCHGYFIAEGGCAGVREVYWYDKALDHSPSDGNDRVQTDTCT